MYTILVFFMFLSILVIFYFEDSDFAKIFRHFVQLFIVLFSIIFSVLFVTGTFKSFVILKIKLCYHHHLLAHVFIHFKFAQVF